MGNCMRGLFKKLRRKRSSERTVTLLVAGLDNAGKTSVLNRISNDPSQDVMPTMGFRIVSLRHKSYSVKVYDIGGAQQIRSIWSKYYNDVHGLIYVVDASDISRLTENKIVFGELIAHEHITGKPILLLANKQDVRGAVDELDLVENLDVERVANTMRCPTRVETCSCMFSADQSKHNTMGIINGYKWLLDTISKNFTTIDNRIKETQNGVSNNRVLRKPSSTSNTLSRSSIRSNPFKPIRELIADHGRAASGSSNENLLDNKKKRSSLKKFLASYKNKTAPMALGERLSKSQNSLHRTGNDVLPINGHDNQNHQTSLVTLDPLNLATPETEDRPRQQNRRPFTAPQVFHRQDPLILFNIPGQVPQ